MKFSQDFRGLSRFVMTVITLSFVGIAGLQADPSSSDPTSKTKWDGNLVDQLISQIKNPLVYKDCHEPGSGPHLLNDSEPLPIPDSEFDQLKQMAAGMANKAGVGFCELRNQVVYAIDSLISPNDNVAIDTTVDLEHKQVTIDYKMKVPETMAQELGVPQEMSLYEVQFLWAKK